MPTPIRGITDYAKDAILAALQEFFSNKKNVGPDLLFSQNAAESSILIADKYTINLKDVEKKAAIVVIRGAQAWSNRGLDQHKGWEGPGVADRFTDLVNGAFSCTCMSKQGLEAESIAHTVFTFFRMFRRTIRKTFKGIHDITSVQLGEELLAVSDSDVDVSVVPVTLNLSFQWTWKLEQVGPVLRDVKFNQQQKNGQVFTRFMEKTKPALT